MADPIDFPEANLRLLPPVGREAEVRDMFAQQTDDGRVVSCWRLAAEDLRRIADTGEIWLSIWSGGAVPPVFVTGLKEQVI